LEAWKTFWRRSGSSTLPPLALFPSRGIPGLPRIPGGTAQIKGKVATLKPLDGSSTLPRGGARGRAPPHPRAPSRRRGGPLGRGRAGAEGRFVWEGAQPFEGRGGAPPLPLFFGWEGGERVPGLPLPLPPRIGAPLIPLLPQFLSFPSEAWWRGGEGGGVAESPSPGSACARMGIPNPRVGCSEGWISGRRGGVHTRPCGMYLGTEERPTTQCALLTPFFVAPWLEAGVKTPRDHHLGSQCQNAARNGSEAKEQDRARASVGFLKVGNPPPRV